MSRKKAEGNLKTAYVFFFFVAGLILISLFFKAIFLLKESKFDGSSHFILEIKNIQNKTQLVSFSPNTSAIGVLNIDGIDVSSLEIPIDAKVKSKNFSDENITTSLSRMIFDFGNQGDLNSIDILRLMFFSMTVKDSSITKESINNSSSKLRINSISSSLFIDPKISDEKLNIEVVNSTDVYGLGNKVANMISNIGGNVILVSTGDLKKTSQIEFVKDDYTVDKLASLFHLQKIAAKKISLPDVIITIGSDYVH